eukprot:g1176.t1
MILLQAYAEKYASGVLGGWQKRYFVLSEQSLQYYRNEKEAKAPDIRPKQTFELQSDTSVVREKNIVLLEHKESDFNKKLRFKSEDMATQWYDAIFNIVNKDPLDPKQVKQFIDFLVKYGLKTEGLFRVPGESETIKSLKIRCDSGDKVNVNAEFVPNGEDGKPELHDIHNVAGLLKLYIRDLPVSMLSAECFDAFLSVSEKKDVESKIETVSTALKKLKPHRRAALSELCFFLNKLASFRSVNKMSEKNLARCFTPTLFTESNSSGSPADLHAEVARLSKVESVVSDVLIGRVSDVFVEEAKKLEDLKEKKDEEEREKARRSSLPPGRREEVRKSNGEVRKAASTVDVANSLNSSHVSEKGENTWANWKTKKTKDGRTYYVNRLTRKASWSAGGLRAYWIKTKTPDGLTYYYHSVTKVRRWDEPSSDEQNVSNG